MALRVLVCGGRRFNDPELLGSWLGGIHKQRGIALLIDGGAHGADRMANLFAKWLGIPTQTFEAQWGKYGRAAGPKRNRRMLEEGRPDLVVAFPGGPGTADMIRQAHELRVPVLDVSLPQSIAKYEIAQSEYANRIPLGEQAPNGGVSS